MVSTAATVHSPAIIQERRDAVSQASQNARIASKVNRQANMSDISSSSKMRTGGSQSMTPTANPAIQMPCSRFSLRNRMRAALAVMNPARKIACSGAAPRIPYQRACTT